MGDEGEFGSRCLERPDQYEGEEAVTVEAWPSTIGRRQRRSERLVVLAEWIEFFSRPTPIRRLRLKCRVNDRLLAALAPQDQLESLSLFWGSYSALDVLASMSELRSLSLGGASAVTDVSPLVRLTHLRGLELMNTRKLKDYSPLAELSSLRTLCVHRGITGARSHADSLEFVRSLPDLDEFWWDPRVAGADYTPLLELTSASKIGVTPMKGMSPSMVDLEWALPGMRAVNAENSARLVPVVSSDGDVSIMTTDVVGRTVLVEATATDDVDLAEPLWGPEIQGPVSGLTLRTFSHTARTRTERFWMLLESPQTSVDMPPGAEEILAGYEFSGDAAGPLLVWDCEAPVATADEVEHFFAGNTDIWTYRAPIRLDTTGLQPLPDEEFWEVIDVLGGKAYLMASYKAVRALIPRGEEFMLRWAHTFSEHALPLMPIIESLQQRRTIPPSRGWHAVGAVIAAGRVVYEAVVTNPDAFDPRLLRNADFDSVVIAQTAIRRNRPEVDAVVTRLSLLWDTTEAAQATQRLLTERTPPFTRMHCARGILRVDGSYRERLVLVDWGDHTDERSTGLAAAALGSFGGDLLMGPDIADLAVDHLAHAGSVFTIRRRSAIPIDEYLGIYAPRSTGGAWSTD